MNDQLKPLKLYFLCRVAEDGDNGIEIFMQEVTSRRAVQAPSGNSLPAYGGTQSYKDFFSVLIS
jgi:hypothetical protein